MAAVGTDWSGPGEAKDADDSNVCQLYQAFASADETAAMRREFEQGIGWGDAKQRLFERIDSEVAPLRERYETLMAEPQKIERLLRDGARRLARKSGVEGRRGSVRVDPGGRRILKKKKQTATT